jgi:subtilisin-like proprotein convertase family protein
VTLEVTLSGPDGTRVKVHERTGGSSDNLITSYESRGGGRLAPFVGKALGGVWQLEVADLAGLDIGKLNRWRLGARA